MSRRLLKIILILIVLQYAQSSFFTCDDLVQESLGQCQNLRSETGEVNVRGLNISYKIYVSDQQDNSKLPLILIHGGPGFGGGYFETMKTIACKGRTIIIYDQGAAGFSQRPDNITQDAPWLFELSYYTEELQSLIDHLKLSQYHILGHSWGSVVATQFALTQPQGLKGLILAGALVDSQFYIQEQRRLRHSTLPTYIQKVLREAEEKQDYDSELYQILSDHLMSFFTFRVFPIPDCIEQAFPRFNREIYVALQGPSEFTVKGLLENYNVTDRLHEIKNPTLVTGGEYDTMTETTLQVIVNQIQGSELKIFERAGHMTMIDEPENYNYEVNLFLDRVEQKLAQDNHKNEL